MRSLASWTIRSFTRISIPWTSCTETPPRSNMKSHSAPENLDGKISCSSCIPIPLPFMATLTTRFRSALDFLHGDTAKIEHEIALSAGKPGWEDLMLFLHSNTAAFHGHINDARSLSRRAADSALRAELKEPAALWLADAALREAAFGNREQARQFANDSGKIAPSSRDAQLLVGLALARAGDSARAQAIADDLNRRFPVNTVIQSVWLPAIRAQVELTRGNAAKAVDLLQPATPYELGEGIGSLNFVCILPAYIRGEAYLGAKKGAEAVAEFRKILDHRGLVSNCWTGSLAHLDLARAYTLSGDTAKARTNYQDFLALWKDGDPSLTVHG